MCAVVFDRDRGVVGGKNGMGTATSGVLGLGHDVVFNTTRFVPAVDVGNGGMVESLRRVTQGLANTRVPRGRVVIHDVRATTWR